MKQAWDQLNTVISAGKVLARIRFKSLNRRHDLTEEEARFQFEQEIKLAQEFIGLLSENEKKAFGYAMTELGILEREPRAVDHLAHSRREIYKGSDV